MYDAHSNITDVTKDGVLQYHYGYDMMNQLVSVDDKLNGKVYNYTYDAGGNLISETVTDSNGTTSNDYEYNNSNWGDVLTSYNGQNITYDEIGNPLTYRDGMSMTWKNGRQLATLTNGDTSISYGYDSDSVRTTKTVNGVKYTYAYLNGQLLYETRGDAKFYYSYDANGILYNVRYTLTDGDTEYSYYYTHNSRGDIVGIYNGAGELKAHYEYDAWGNVISITDNNGNAITNPNHIGNLNPFRYRGYYQDTETGLYYLMSRYYDPITHRFINADGYFQSGTSILDANTFAYCGNNPVLNVDPFGTCKVPNYTSAGTYIGRTWKVVQAIPGTPNFCNVCKCYRPGTQNNVAGSAEHHKKGTTTPSNRNRHEKGQQRKKMDNGGEKGDKRRKEDRSNKRHISIDEANQYLREAYFDIYDFSYAKENTTIAVAAVAIVFLVSDDVSAIGIADDAAIPYFTSVIWDALS